MVGLPDGSPLLWQRSRPVTLRYRYRADQFPDIWPGFFQAQEDITGYVSRYDINVVQYMVHAETPEG